MSVIELPPMLPARRTHGRRRWPIVLAVLVLTYLVAVVFFPITGFDFTDYDVDEQLVHNPYIRGLTGENLKHIFTSPCVTSYYPVRTLTYAIDYTIWGLEPGGFKLTNGLLHWGNVVLVFCLILRLYREAPGRAENPRSWDVFAAAFAAGIFAVHPLVVEPVTWVPGREELLMTLGTLVCFHCHLSARRLGNETRRSAAFLWQAAAAVSCAAACLSNAVAAVIPAIVTTWDLLTLGKPRWRRLILGTGALWLIGVATILIKILGPTPDSADLELGTDAAGRLMLVFSVYWLNVKSLVWPAALALCYSRVTPGSFVSPTVVLGAITLGATCLAVWKLRRQKMLVFGLLWFGIALVPSSQIMMHHVHRADRFLYLPLVGLAIFAAFAWGAVWAVLKGRAAQTAAVVLAVLVILALDMRSIRQVQIWRDNLALWERCVEICPDNSTAQDMLARNLMQRGQVERAGEHALRSLELDFAGNQLALRTRALQLIESRKFGQGGFEEAVRLARRACDLTEWKDPKCLYTLAQALLAAGERDSAIATAEQAAERAEDAGADEFARKIRQWLRDVRTSPSDPHDRRSRDAADDAAHLENAERGEDPGNGKPGL